jgi:hypothetical protein
MLSLQTKANIIKITIKMKVYNIIGTYTTLTHLINKPKFMFTIYYLTN